MYYKNLSFFHYFDLSRYWEICRPWFFFDHHLVLLLSIENHSTGSSSNTPHKFPHWCFSTQIFNFDNFYFITIIIHRMNALVRSTLSLWNYCESKFIIDTIFRCCLVDNSVVDGLSQKSLRKIYFTNCKLNIFGRSIIVVSIIVNVRLSFSKKYFILWSLLFNTLTSCDKSCKQRYQWWSKSQLEMLCDPVNYNHRSSFNWFFI